MSPNGGTAMRRAVHRAYVWAIYSENNKAAFSDANFSLDAYTLSMMNEAAPQTLEALLDLAIEHHGEVSRVAVVGYDDPVGADDCLREFGYERDRDVTGLEYRRAKI